MEFKIGTPDNRITDWNLLVDRDIRIGGDYMSMLVVF